jgi:hypothetical protein
MAAQNLFSPLEFLVVVVILIYSYYQSELHLFLPEKENPNGSQRNLVQRNTPMLCIGFGLLRLSVLWREREIQGQIIDLLIGENKFNQNPAGGSFPAHWFMKVGHCIVSLFDEILSSSS